LYTKEVKNTGGAPSAKGNKTMSKLFGKKQTEKWFIPKDMRDMLIERFKELKEKVTLEVFTTQGENDPYNELAVKFTKDNITGVKLKDTKDGTIREIKTDGVFVAIGQIPNIRIASEIGVKLSDSGFIEVDRGGRTNFPRIYAAGDVTGGVRQIVTAVSEGATAALSAFEDISNPYWISKN
jgi:thioredoxin reductase